MCFALLPWTTVLNKSCGQDFLWKLLSFHTEMISAKFLIGEMCFLEESYKKMQKIQIFKILRVPSIWNQGVCLLSHIKIWCTSAKEVVKGILSFTPFYRPTKREVFCYRNTNFFFFFKARQLILFLHVLPFLCELMSHAGKRPGSPF